MLSPTPGAIGIFDSGYGGLTIFEKIARLLPEYDYIYLGDNARAPYGTRSFDVVYEFTLQSVEKLFEMGCHLVILACNTASAKALRTIQQKDLPHIAPNRRVLGIIRPTVEMLDGLTKSKHVGILGTVGTIQSNSYALEIQKLFPEIKVVGEACPMWVPLVENNEYETAGADFFIKKNIDHLLKNDSQIDTLILACTHFPLLLNKIKQFVSPNINIISQGEIVAESLKQYLQVHPEIEQKCSKNGKRTFYTTEEKQKFAESASVFLKHAVSAKRIAL
ncbi:MAG: glutamate racemase [Prevotellaceae bacterium]|jgi:glutamate racemase|nr:glutamate racemase [Prevotellaceae bacterium]